MFILEAKSILYPSPLPSPLVFNDRLHPFITRLSCLLLKLSLIILFVRPAFETFFLFSLPFLYSFFSSFLFPYLSYSSLQIKICTDKLVGLGTS